MSWNDSVPNATYQLLLDKRDDMVWRVCGAVRELDASAISYLVDTGLIDGLNDVDDVDLVGRVNDAFQDMLDQPYAPLNQMLPRLADRLSIAVPAVSMSQDQVSCAMSLWEYSPLLALLAANDLGIVHDSGLFGVRPKYAADLDAAMKRQDRTWIRSHAILRAPGGLSDSELERFQSTHDRNRLSQAERTEND
ncbi:MAG: hypothetical protein PUF51_00315 [Bifidobacteriaceae bacterium]|nr:hypothetical protein [Bifidobacteriaceae bacterium]